MSGAGSRLARPKACCMVPQAASAGASFTRFDGSPRGASCPDPVPCPAPPTAVISLRKIRGQAVRERGPYDAVTRGKAGDRSGLPAPSQAAAKTRRQNARPRRRSRRTSWYSIGGQRRGRGGMGSSTRVIRAALLAAAAVALAAAAFLLREKHQEAEAAVQSIQDQLEALDPATRAAVIARLTSDEVKRVKGS